MLNKKSKIYVAGHKGMVGSAVLKELIKNNYTNIMTRTSTELDLTDQSAVSRFFMAEKPEYVVLAAAKVGGINANIKYPAKFLYENLMIQNNIIHNAYLNGTKKLLFLGSSCIYPCDCRQPMREEDLLTGKLEPTNEGYALAKIAGLKLVEFYYRQYGFESVSLMPCNLYGPNDSFDLENSHVLSALVKRFTDITAAGQNKIVLWGSGTARREFMHVNDLARAVLFFLINYSAVDFVNIGWGTDISIKELAVHIANKTGFRGNIVWDTSKPDGMKQKLLDISLMKNIGFVPKISLAEGIDEMITIYKDTLKKAGKI